MSSQVTYSDAGVDIVEGARAVDAIRPLVKSTYRDEVIGDIGGFGGLFSIASARDMQDPVLVSGTDGVGTKLKLAQIADIHSTVGIDLVAMCVNDILATGAEPLFFLDYVAAGKIESQKISQIVSGIAEGCKQAGCALIGGEMAEHPGVMFDDDYDLSGFCVGLVDRPKMLLPENSQEGDVLIGLPSSGIHSNGYSLVRKVVLGDVSFASTSSQSIIDEKFTLPDSRFGGKSVLEALLEPTRIYVSALRSVLDSCSGAVHSVAHITGGGITENLNRALSSNTDAIVEKGSWPSLPIIDYICSLANLTEEEAYKTFNMGLGMVLVVDSAYQDEVESALDKAGEAHYCVGKLTSGAGNVLYK